MVVKREKLTLSNYISYLTNRASRYSHYAIASATIAIPLFVLLFVLWGLRLNFVTLLINLKEEDVSQDVILSIENTIQEIRAVEGFSFGAVIFFAIIAVFLTFISYWENYKLKVFMTKDGPIDLEELRKKFNIKDEWKETKNLVRKLIPFIRKKQ